MCLHTARLSSQRAFVAFGAKFVKAIADLQWTDRTKRQLVDFINTDISTNRLVHIMSPTNGKPYYKSDTTSMLNIASQFSTTEIIRFLLEYGANVDYSDENGENALHKACKSKVNCAEKVKMLTIYSPNITKTATRRDAVLPLHLAASNENSSCLQSILSYGNTSQLVNAATKMGYTCSTS